MDRFKHARVVVAPRFIAEGLVRAVAVHQLAGRGRSNQARRQSSKRLQLRKRQLFESGSEFQAIAIPVDQMIWPPCRRVFHRPNF